jgi:hypothetical protein
LTVVVEVLLLALAVAARAASGSQRIATQGVETDD